MTGSAHSFVATLAASGLMTPDEIKAALKQCKREDRVDSQSIAEALYRRGKLTAYQAKELLGGRTSGLVLGNYVILDQLGAGGMGVVYKAQHKRMKRLVALKMLPPQMVNSEEAVKRFHREVEAAARLEHPNIVTAYDADEAEGAHFLVMQYVEGSDLARYVRRCGRLTVRSAVDYTLQAARGLHYAHQKGIIHRDIKPGNLLLDGDGVVRVLDMGLARLEHPESDRSGFETHDELTGTGRVIGTVDYMAPEQTLDAKHVDRRADIYSLGCTLHFLLTGRSPAPDGSLTEKLLWHESGPVPSLLEARPDVPPELNVVFRRMLARRPADRYASLAATISELELCLNRISETSEPTLDQRPHLAGQGVETVAVIIPEVVPEGSRLQVQALEALANVETHRGQTYPDATIVDPATAHVAKARRREQAMVLPAIGISICLLGVFVVLLILSVDRGSPTQSGWNEEVKRKLQQILSEGVEKAAGRQLYTEIDTAMETGCEGDWRVGEGLTASGEPYAIRVRKSKLEAWTISKEQARAAGLASMSVQASLDVSFPHRSQPLLTLHKPQLRLVTLPSGELRLQGTVFRAASEKKSVENAVLAIQRRTQQGRQVQTQAVYQQLDDWQRLTTGVIHIDVAAPDPPPAVGDTLELIVIGFLYEPKPGLYRVSNQPTCLLSDAPPTSP